MNSAHILRRQYLNLVDAFSGKNGAVRAGTDQEETGSLVAQIKF